MSDKKELIKISKDASAQEAANATIDFYKLINSEKDLPKEFLNLAQNLSSISSELGNSTSGDSSNSRRKANGSSTDAAPAPQSRKRVVDPNAPKKPYTVYIVFGLDERKRIQEERAQKGLEPLKNNEMTTEIARRWNSLSDKEKEPYTSVYKQKMEIYNVEKEKYKQSLKNQETKVPVKTGYSSEADEVPGNSYGDEGNSESPAEAALTSEDEHGSKKNGKAKRTRDDASSKKDKKRRR
ncbi:hypothetical protein DV495_002480 [Geotrichum candidum]|nr:hypothetical protein DV452_004128 [Geotrichum candidum]KAI9213942.1 hypothetical protein DS838_001177 [Geotrichum bryndzae]KAF5113354.1 hypothetical protein DV454_003643 [Geotrichum candidum]KAF5129196.1 hypothetical protein DV495_002480 [Geotrichum candidum]KAF7501091.1 hypothetical protein DV113_000817 [Geotrichum candidum]